MTGEHLAIDQSVLSGIAANQDGIAAGQFGLARDGHLEPVRMLGGIQRNGLPLEVEPASMHTFDLKGWPGSNPPARLVRVRTMPGL